MTSGIILAITAVITAWIIERTPSMARPTFPLGVSIPSDRIKDPAVLRARRSWSLGCAAIGLIAAAICVAAGNNAKISASALAASLVALIAWHAVARRSIIRAKHEGGWFEGKAQRKVAALTDAPGARPRWGFFVVAFLITGLTIALLALRYDALADPYPTHWGIDGQPNVWADKSIGSVFGHAIIAPLVVAILAAVSWAQSKQRGPLDASSEPEEALRVRNAVDADTQTMGAILAVISATWLSLLLNAGAFGFSTGLNRVILVVGIVCIIATVVFFAVRTVRIRRSAVPRPVGVGGPDATAAIENVDDDAHWIGGTFYVNRDNPALILPKASGLGQTINLGHPAGMAFGIATIALVIGGIVVAFILAT